ncbi:MAG: sigma-54-dependent Fis family transcriptional regulator [Calditrichaceae bacterium]|nr:sigma-54-dependent Fis family transcriptional regulator [Calditrichaceae bacterium]MBN2708940.1 sigma-54-dependent Fis family transcriptional regulator [Calditrichaceae bacterium]RQV97537.1 MAG: sigma-54-dependent Fis family transcriptional regulator [Calditrichota bacterium]
MIFSKNINLLVIEDEDYDVHRIRKTIEPFKGQILIQDVVADGNAALELLEKKKRKYDVIIMDYQIVGGLSGERLITRIKEIYPSIQIIVVTKKTVNISDFDFANRLIEAGAMWYCTKYPGDIDEYIYQPTDFILSIFNAYEKKQLAEESLKTSHKLKLSIEDILKEKQIVGCSDTIQKMRMQIEKAAKQDATVIIYGASGTGKELVATHIHYLSKRKFEKFVVINGGSLPDDLIESELFGFERGSFTGANSTKAGLFEVADHGTIFLDEVGELPPSAQVKLLRVLQEGELDKIGRIDKVKVDVRIIAATNRDLHQAIEEKSFREDLFYRLNVVNIHVPTLKERREDIPLLLDYFLQQFCRKMNFPVPEIDKKALEYLVQYDWPGNVRQLQNVIQRLLFLSEGKIKPADVENAFGPKNAKPQKMTELWDENNLLPWKEIEKEMKRRYFSVVREKSKSDADAARILGLAPPNFYRMCKELGLK